MGAMATLMYLIKSRLDKKPHYVSRAILLSPAGVHKTVSYEVPSKAGSNFEAILGTKNCSYRRPYSNRIIMDTSDLFV